MNRFKKVISGVVLSLTVCLFSFGCTSKENRLSSWRQNSGKLKVLSTTAQVNALVWGVGKDRVDALVLIEKNLDPHSYELVKGDMEKFELADLIFYNGLGLEHGGSLSSKLKNAKSGISIGDFIKNKFPEKILMADGVIDPHIWMDMDLWKEGAYPVAEALTRLDPEGESYYRENAEALLDEMRQGHLDVLSALQEIPSEKRFLVTSHDAFQYFTRRYLADEKEVSWKKRFRAPEGLAPEGQLSPKDIQKIITFLKENEIHVIFPESNVSKDSIRKIASAAKELGMEIAVCKEPLFGDAMGDQSYLAMMKKNAETIKKHLWNTQ